MPGFKCELLLEQATTGPGHVVINARDAGWSELFYIEGELAAIKTKLTDLAVARAGILPVSGLCVGWRITPVLNAGQSVSKSFSFPGGTSMACAMPQKAIRIRMTTGSGHNRAVICAGIPDDIVKGGEYSPTTFFSSQLKAFTDKLIDSFGSYEINRTNVLKTVSAVTTVGAVVTVENHGYSAGDKVRFFRTKDLYGNTVKGTWTVIEPITSTGFSLMGYNQPGRTSYGAVAAGKIRKISGVFSGFVELGRIVSTMRKVGRPFDLFRGKASKRR